MKLGRELQALVELARRQRYGDGRDGWARLQARRAQHTLRWRLAWSAAAVAVVTLVAWQFRADAALRYRPLPSAEASIASTLDFSDGSRVDVHREAVLRVDAVTERGATLHLERGRSSLSIVPKPGAAWAVAAGPYRVRVTGTAFDVTWLEREGRFEIEMRHGSVVVTGPLAGGGISLRAGQRLRATPRQHALAIDRADELPEAATLASDAATLEPAAQAPEAATLEAEGQAEAPEERGQEPRAVADQARTRGQREARSPRRARRATDARQAVEPSWSSLISRGEFEAVIREASARGIPQTLQHASAEELSALADAARYARSTELARRALLALRERHPDAAQSSAFLLARISDDDEALVWYGRYLQEAPRGLYVSQALGRRMVILHARGEQARARADAAAYLARDPRGPYAVSARAILR